jgi:hypothetical protein
VIWLFSAQKMALCVGNALTEILPFIYARLHDQKNPNSLLRNRFCQHLCCPGPVSRSGRIACRGAFAGKTAHPQKSSNHGFTSRGRRIGFAGRVARYITKSQARWQESRVCGSGESGRITVACQVLTWRSVQAEKFCDGQAGSRDRRRRKDQKRRGCC